MSARQPGEPTDDPRRVLILNQYIAPDTTPSAHYVSDIARALAATALEVTLLAAEPSYSQTTIDVPLRESRDGVKIRRLRMGIWRGRGSKLRRFGGYLRYLIGAAVVGRRLVRSNPPDIVMCFSNPPLVALVARWLARSVSARMVYVIHDIHPDILLATDWMTLPDPVIRAWNALNRVMLQTASVVVVLGEGMKHLLVSEKGVAADRVQVIPLWAEPELRPAERDEVVRAELGVAENELLVLSTGNLGVMHSLEPVLDAARRLEGSQVRFVFVESGVRLEYWRSRFHGLDNVSFVPYRTGEDFSRLVTACDIGLVPLSPGMERFAVPSRAYTFLSAGRPLLAVMNPNADVARLVSDNDCGLATTSGHEIAEWLEHSLSDRDGLKASSHRARTVYEASFTRTAVMNRYLAVCGSLAAHGAPSSLPHA